MKKAKEYAEYILSFKEDEELFIKAMGDTVFELIKEMNELNKVRKISRKSALKSIVLEQDRKWRAVCRLIDMEGMRVVFLDYLKKGLPEFWELLDM